MIANPGGRGNCEPIITVRNSSCGKVMFSQACVKNSVHRGACMAGGHAWWEGGMHGKGKHAWQDGHAWWGHVWQEAVHGGGHAWQGACLAG